MKNQDLRLRLKPVGMRSIADVVLKIAEQLIGAKPITSKNEIPKNIPLIDADEDRLHQITVGRTGIGSTRDKCV